jgi:hypothetical protein
MLARHNAKNSVVLDQLYESTILDLPENQLRFPFLTDAARHLRFHSARGGGSGFQTAIKIMLNFLRM